MSSIQIAVDVLHETFQLINKELFDNKLIQPAITIQSKGKNKWANGWCSVDKVWINKNNKEGTCYELNITAESLCREFFDITATLIHEMTHLYNLQNGIKDVSRSNIYHNKKFKETAENHGLEIVEYSEKIGWSNCSLTEETKELLNESDINQKAFELFRYDYDGIFNRGADGQKGTEDKAKKKKSSSKKYVCPQCGIIIRATKQVNVICADCNVAFEIEVDESEDDDD